MTSVDGKWTRHGGSTECPWRVLEIVKDSPWRLRGTLHGVFMNAPWSGHGGARRTMDAP